MNIWLINHYAVPPQYYPLARPTLFAKHLQKMGHKVIVFAASTVHNADINLVNNNEEFMELYVDGVHYVLIKCHSYKGNGLKRIINMCEFAIKLPRVCKHFFSPDAIVSTSMPPMSCAMGIKLSKHYGVKGIAEIADLWPESLIEYGMANKKSIAVKVLRRLEKWIYMNADKIIFTAGGLYDYICEQNWENDVPKEKIFNINNGIDIEEFNNNKAMYITKDKDLDDTSIFKIVYAGSIRKVNNVGLLLDIAKCVKHPSIKFLIWGEGDEREQLEQRIRNEEIVNVSFKGSVDKKYIPFIVSKADANIAHNNPSDIFRFGISFNKIFDYLAAGKPIICDFKSKYNPVVENGAGVDIGENKADPRIIAQIIEDLYYLPKDEYDRYCDNAKNAAIKYDFQKLTKDLLDVIQE